MAAERLHFLLNKFCSGPAADLVSSKFPGGCFYNESKNYRVGCPKCGHHIDLKSIKNLVQSLNSADPGTICPFRCPRLCGFSLELSLPAFVDTGARSMADEPTHQGSDGGSNWDLVMVDSNSGIDSAASSGHERRSSNASILVGARMAPGTEIGTLDTYSWPPSSSSRSSVTSPSALSSPFSFDFTFQHDHALRPLPAESLPTNSPDVKDSNLHFPFDPSGLDISPLAPYLGDIPELIGAALTQTVCEERPLLQSEFKLSNVLVGQTKFSFVIDSILPEPPQLSVAISANMRLSFRVCHAALPNVTIDRATHTDYAYSEEIVVTSAYPDGSVKANLLVPLRTPPVVIRFAPTLAGGGGGDDARLPLGKYDARVVIYAPVIATPLFPLLGTITVHAAKGVQA
ncbi:hypothetical protein DFJ73DRAFT_816912 [Zopfochytrium polystomum]|nr:hypothetical protein DFJ73DRAFT_816912 [Zopfochytrium polystomum]